MEKKTWKLTPQAKHRALELCREGLTVAAVAERLSKETGLEVTPQAIWRLRSRNAASLVQSLSDELEQAVACHPIATLEGRLAVLENVVTTALAGHETLLKLAKQETLSSRERRECLQTLGRMRSFLPLVTEAIKEAGQTVHRARTLKLALQRQVVKKDGFDRSEVEAAIIRVAERFQLEY